jgi:hypothetical protein
MKIRPLEAEFFHADGQTDGWTDMMQLILFFRNYVHALKNLKLGKPWN